MKHICNPAAKTVGCSATAPISNACKYTPNRGKIGVEISEKGEDILFRIKDNGARAAKPLKEKNR